MKRNLDLIRILFITSIIALLLSGYANLMQEDSWKGYEFIWPGGLQLGSSSYEILCPKSACNIGISPPIRFAGN